MTEITAGAQQESWGRPAGTSGSVVPFERTWSSGPMRARVLLTEEEYRFKYGPSELVCEPGTLRYFRREIQEGTPARTLVVVREPRAGVRVRVNLVAMGEAAWGPMEEAVAALRTLHPERDLSRLSRNEAYRQMGVSDYTWMGPVFLMAMSLSVTAWFGAPVLQHALDGEAVEVTLAEVVERSTSSRNVVVTDGYTLDNGLVYTVSQDGRDTSQRTFVPLVDADWRPGDPVRAVVMWKGFGDEAFDSLPVDRTPGVLRTAFSEGMTRKHRNKWDEVMDEELARDVVVLQIDADTKADLVFWAILSAVGNLLMLIVGFFAFRAVRRQGEAVPADAAAPVSTAAAPPST
jgi:hypothetical protein